MDDDMEDEIICEIFKAFFQLIWKTITIVPMSLASHIIPNIGEISKLYKPTSVIVLTVIIVGLSVFVQIRNNWFKEALQSCHKTFAFNIVTDQSLKNFVTTSIGNDNTKQELSEGIVGVYALQGRRGTMEDKFSVMQEVDVGGTKKISFFGVYDGHGGQFVAEYVKENLFTNTVQKLRQLRNLVNEKNVERKRGSISQVISIKKRPSFCTTITENSDEQVNENKSRDKKEEENGKLKGDEVDSAKPSDQVNGSKPEKNEKPKGKENGKEEKSVNNDESNEVSMKKDDPYSNFKLKKRLSEASLSTTLTNKEVDQKTDSSEGTSYIDINSNVNYTKLLNDQIMDIDEKVVQFCKTSTDFSGTTAVIAVLDGEMLIIGNVGDSRAVMGDLKGSTIPLSFDHKPNQLKERKRIKEAGGFITFTGVWRVAGVLATSRALGDFPLKDPRKLITAEPDVLTFSLKDHKAHFVILATDGLWDVLSNEEAVAFVRKHINERDYGARSLVLHAYERGSQDNITAMILNLDKLSL